MKLYSPKALVLVVSPFNSVIKDRILSCKRLGIKAIKIEGDLPSLEGKEIAYVHTNPEHSADLEFVVNHRVIPELGERLLAIVVDKSHWVVNW